MSLYERHVAADSVIRRRNDRIFVCASILTGHYHSRWWMLLHIYVYLYHYGARQHGERHMRGQRSRIYIKAIAISAGIPDIA